jgi:zinc transporter ZupT
MALSIAILLGGLVAAYVLHVIWQWRRLSHIPGPFTAGFSKLWVFREAILLRLPTSYEELGRRYGESSLTLTAGIRICVSLDVALTNSSDRVTRARRP